MESKNRKARHDYEILDSIEAGMQLLGTEVKSLRENAVTFGDAFCYFSGKELFVKNLRISPWNNSIHDPDRDKKLLLKSRELLRLKKELINGLTIIPLDIYTNKKGLFKVKIGLAKGKKNWDKRETTKQRDIERDLRQKNY